MDIDTAYDILSRSGIPKGEDYHRLTSEQVDGLLAFADELKYRKPKHANGSRARYFHAFVERVANRRERAFRGFVSKTLAEITTFKMRS